MSLLSKIGATSFALALLALTAFAADPQAHFGTPSRASASVALNPQPLPPFVDPGEDAFDRG